jgi:hypothetical protein
MQSMKQKKLFVSKKGLLHQREQSRLFQPGLVVCAAGAVAEVT